MSTWTIWHHHPATSARAARARADGLDGQRWISGLRLTLRVAVTLVLLGGIGVGIGLGIGWAVSSVVHVLLGPA